MGMDSQCRLRHAMMGTLLVEMGVHQVVSYKPTTSAAMITVVSTNVS